MSMVGFENSHFLEKLGEMLGSIKAHTHFGKILLPDEILSILFSYVTINPAEQLHLKNGASSVLIDELSYFSISPIEEREDFIPEVFSRKRKAITEPEEKEEQGIKKQNRNQAALKKINIQRLNLAEPKLPGKGIKRKLIL